MNEVEMWAVGGFRTLFFYLDEIVYKFVIDLYDIFRYICGVRVTNNAIMNELSTRIGWVLGLIMFFYISFDFIQILLDPDKISDKDKGPLNIIKKFLVVIVLLGTSRYIFDLMYNFQEIVLSDNNGEGSIIEKLVLPFKVNTSSFGRTITSNFMYNFYKVNDLVDYEEDDDTGVITFNNTDDEDPMMDKYTFSECVTYTYIMYTTIQNEGSFSIGNKCLTEKFEYDVGSGRMEFFIDFDLISLPVGLFVAWTLLMYCISVGMRVIQLAVLQIVSPAAIICYLSPNKENTFTKWLKLYFSTYIDVFIRIAIIDFVVLLSGLILEFNQATPGGTLTSKMEFWVQVFMILALLSFAKKAPELFKKLLPEKLQSGLSFGIGTEERAGLGILGGALAGGITGIIGGVAGGKGLSKVSGFFSGAVGGVGRGLSAGWTGKNLRESLANARKNQATANLNRAQRIASGVSLHERLGDSFRDSMGIMSGYAAEDKALTMSSNVKTLLEGEDPVKYLREAREAYRSGGGTDYTVYQQFADAEKEILAQQYSWAYNHDSGDAQLVVRAITDSQGNVVSGAHTTTFSSNRAIYNAIHDNEKRAGQKLDSYNGGIYEFDPNNNSVTNFGNAKPTSSASSYKQDNNELKTRKADRRNSGNK